MIRVLDDNFYTIQETAEILKVSVYALRNYYNKGLKHYNVKGRTYIPETAIIDYLEVNKAPKGRKPRKKKGGGNE